MAWTKGRLGELFSGLTLVEGPAKAHTTGLESVTGETVHQYQLASIALP